MNKKGWLTLAFAVLSCFGGAEVAQAASSTISLDASATVSNNCTISAGSLNFGTYDTLASSPDDDTGTVTITCTPDAPVTLELNLGVNASGSQRRMTNGTNFLNYEIYQDAGRTIVWGSVASGQHQTAMGTGAAQNFTAYGRIPALQKIPAGSYSDTVIATVNF
ncbi:MAG: Csu type fimbrial protein [Candidatus Binatia bacterium]